MSDINGLHNEGEMLAVKAHTEILAEKFLSGSYQSHVLITKQTSFTNFCPVRLRLNDTYRDRVKQETNNKEQLIRKQYKCAQKYSPTHGRYSVEQRRQAIW